MSGSKTRDSLTANMHEVADLWLWSPFLSLNFFFFFTFGRKQTRIAIRTCPLLRRSRAGERQESGRRAAPPRHHWQGQLLQPSNTWTDGHVSDRARASEICDPLSHLVDVPRVLTRCFQVSSSLLLYITSGQNSSR